MAGRMGSLLLLLLCAIPLISANYEFQCRSYSDELCVAGNIDCCHDDEDLDLTSGYILQDEVFGCAGRITEWTIETENSGILYACVWEPFGAGYKLLGYNKLESITDDVQTFKIPLEKQITVKAGYVIGGLYDETSIDEGILWSTHNDDIDQWAAFSLGRYRHFDDGSIDLHVGDVVDSSTLSKVALRTTMQAEVRVIERPLRLFPSTAARAGRAEIFLNYAWGTICDKWVQTHGWPMTFCRCLGYPEDKEWKYVDQTAPPDPVIVKAAATMDIHAQSPRECAPSYNNTIPECPVHPNGTCGHELDVYVKCHSKWRCVELGREGIGNGCEMVNCQPQYWIEEGGCWSNICETRGEDYLSLSKASWLNAFCKDSGFEGSGNTLGGFDDPTAFNEVFTTDVTCAGDSTTDITQCQTRFRKDEGCPYSAASGVPHVQCKSCVYE